MSLRRRSTSPARSALATATTVAGAVALASAVGVSAAHAAGGPAVKPPRPPGVPVGGAAVTGAPSFAVGQLQAGTVGASGCGTNTAGEPSVHVSRAGLVGLGSENGIGGGSALWTGPSGASACGLTYRGQPNAVGGVGAAGGDIDTAFAPVPDPVSGTYRVYVASLNLGSINVARSTDDGRTFVQTPVQGGVPVDDREWIAAYGSATSLLSYHDVATNNIDILRTDSPTGPYTQIATAIPGSDYRAANNELGNLVIDHGSGTGSATSPFTAYQSFVAPSTPTGSVYNEAFLAVSADGGHTWVDEPIGCSVNGSPAGLNHQFPNVSVAPNGTLVQTWSDDTHVFAAASHDRGRTWSCTGPLGTAQQAIEPWVVTTDAGTDLVYYSSPDAPGTAQHWYVSFAQAPASSAGAPVFGVAQQVVAVHTGAVCEGGASCTTGRQLFDDFGIDTDPQGLAHIAYSHDAPALGGSGTYTGYAVQTGGTAVGRPN